MTCSGLAVEAPTASRAAGVLTAARHATKTAIVELAFCLAERGETILLPDPGYPDYSSGVTLAGAVEERILLEAESGFVPLFSV